MSSSNAAKQLASAALQAGKLQQNILEWKLLMWVKSPDMPLSVSFTLINFLPLSNCPVLSTCEYVSPVSHLTDTCPDRSNCRTLIGALDIQISFCMLMLYVRLSPYTPPFYRHRPTSRPVQPSGSPRPVGLETRRLRLKYQIIYIYIYIYIYTISSSIDDRRPTRTF